MKKIFTLLYLLCIQYVSYAQSLEITPNTVTQKTSTIEQINMQSVQTPTISGIRHSNTLVSPSATANSSILMRVIGKGHTGSSFTDSRVGIHFNATQAWTPTANGTEINFFTTPNNSTSILSRMKISHDGKVGIGTSTPEHALDVAGRINSNVGFSINGVAITPGYYYATSWMNASGENVDATIDGTCLRTRKLIIPELTSDMINQATILVYFRIGSIGPYLLPYTSDAGGYTNQIHYTLKTPGEITITRHTFNSCRFSSANPETYPGEPVMVSMPQSLEYRVIIFRP